ncbi:MAG: glycerol-3-phosphate 1-O-acyltransferase PlsY [Coriobacteriales bacterium]|jgi:glycerol-3-phosphate acyltransferase PlsY|nr:glycerol-3-phosphate 1-O-acyltransferase PlsY [Coriobacteriales bacterium]
MSAPLLSVLLLLASFVLASLLGSIPWGIIISRIFFRTDIRKHGSGNIGTTNALRTLGKRGGGAVFALDFSKGFAAGLLVLAVARAFLPNLNALLGAAPPATTALIPPLNMAPPLPQGAWLSEQGLLAVALLSCTLGHIFSPWLGFKGGKGIAVAVGCSFVTLGWLGALIELAVFIVLVVLTRYVSVGSIAAAVACPLMALWLYWGDWLAILPCVILGAIIVWAHRDNIKRLVTHTEPRLSSKKGPPHAP